MGQSGSAYGDVTFGIRREAEEGSFCVWEACGLQQQRSLGEARAAELARKLGGQQQ